MASKRVTTQIAITLIAVLIVTAAVAGGLWWRKHHSMPDGVVATVDGQPITEWDVNMIISSIAALADKKYADLPTDTKLALVKEAAAQKKLLALANASNVINDADVQAQLQTFTNNLVKEAYLTKTAKARITEADVQARYDELAKELDGKNETHLYQILLKTEEEAQKTVDELKYISFEDLAKARSIDTVTAVRGGDLGYVIPGQMAKNIEDAVGKLNPGQLSAPIQTPFGWHVIKVADRRLAKPMPLEKVRDRVEADLIHRNMRVIADDLLKDSKIELR